MKNEIERLEQPVTVLKSRRLPTDILDTLQVIKIKKCELQKMKP